MLPITVTPTKEHHCKFIKIYKFLCEEISVVFQLRSYYILLSFQIQYSTCISFQCASWMRYFNGERYSQSHWYVKKGFLSFFYVFWWFLSLSSVFLLTLFLLFLAIPLKFSCLQSPEILVLMCTQAVCGVCVGDMVGELREQNMTFSYALKILMTNQL